MFASEALKVAFKNKYKRWVPVTEKEKNDSNVAMHRYKEAGFFGCNVEPKFSIPQGSRIYTIGSCFARNIEKAMDQVGMDVIGMDFSVDTDILFDTVGVNGNKVNQRSILNKYSTHSIFSELSRVLDGVIYKDSGFICVGDDNWIDPQLASVFKPLPFDRLLLLRKLIDDLTSEIVNADLVFITLGLIEVWRDNATGLYLNSSPPPVLMRNDNSRFEFLRPSYIETYENIEMAINLIRKKSNKDVRFIVTVSPVPMSTTWSEDDVVVANTYSKSILRAVAQDLALKHNYVDYYPSFEMVVNSPRKITWNDDELHVKSEMVDFIMQQFAERYVETV